MDGNFELKSAAITDRGLSDKRPENEDSYLSLPEHGIFAVADGVGGAMAGDVASEMAVEILQEAFVNYSSSVDPEEIMTVAIDRANAAINQMAGELPQLSSMATTVVALHISGNIATIAHVGDSRLYRLDRDGRLFRETNDHSVVEEEVRAGRMSAAQALNHPSRNVISRAVGAEMTVDIDLKTIIIEPGTTFLLCSDGITRHIDDQEIADFLTTGMSPQTLCEQMKEVCYSRGAEDNLTAIVVQVPDSIAQPTSADAAVPVPIVHHEEETIASARYTFDDNTSEPSVTAASTTPEEETFATPVSSANVVPDLDDEAYLMEQDTRSTDDVAIASEPEVETGEYESSRMSVPAAVPVPAVGQDREISIFGSSDIVKPKREVSAASAGSSMLRSLVYLLLGAVIGAAGIYFFLQNREEPAAQVVPVQDLVPKSSNVPATALEESRWLVDRDPDAFVQSNVASTQNAEDHYILGRALFLSGKHFEAKRQFALAEGKLGDVDPKKVATFRADMAMMSSIIEDPQAAENFKRAYDIARQRSGSPADASNSNTGAASNANTAANSGLIP